MTRRVWHVTTPALVLLIGACAHSKIPRTNIDDTTENREILNLVEEYTRAVESRDAAAVLALVSPRYYEDNGNTDRSDDYDYKGLKSGLTEDFSRTKAMQLQVRVDDIKVDDDTAYAELYYTYRAQNEYPSGLQWDTGSDRTRLRFQRTEEGRWMIVGGL
jgi:ketosteroid isomerase-like protein